MWGVVVVLTKQTTKRDYFFFSKFVAQLYDVMHGHVVETPGNPSETTTAHRRCAAISSTACAVSNNSQKFYFVGAKLFFIQFFLHLGQQ